MVERAGVLAHGFTLLSFNPTFAVAERKRAEIILAPFGHCLDTG
jgi:hypothetical protein